MEYRPKTLVVVRHGETEWNKVAKAVRTKQMEVPAHLKGVPNPLTVLSEDGEAQAVATGKKFAEQYGSFDAVFYSPYVRTRQTVHGILDQFPVAERVAMRAELRSDIFLVEQNPGELDQALHDDPEEEHRIYQKYRSLAMRHGHFYLQYANVESWAQVALRVYLFLHKVYQERYHDKKILIVTHGITTMLFRHQLEGLTELALESINEHDHPKNCGTYEYRWNSVNWEYDLARRNEIYYQ